MCLWLLTCMNNFAGINDGSTEAAMTLLAMGDPMFQLKTSTEGMIWFMGQTLAWTLSPPKKGQSSYCIALPSVAA